MHKTMALIFDFDGTLVPDSTSALLEAHGVDPDIFWEEAREWMTDGFDPTLAYLQMMLERIGPDRQMGALSRGDLADFGRNVISDQFYPGVTELFEDVRGIVGDVRDVGIDIYIISSGLRDLIRATEPVREHVDDVYASVLNEREGHLHHMKKVVTFTEKTRYLFEINKGLTFDDSRSKPYLVNEDVERRIQFEHMIYVGDGLTDVPCFSLLEEKGGRAHGVFDPGSDHSARRAVEKLLAPRRVTGLYTPAYGMDDDLGAILRAEVKELCRNMSG